MSCPLGKLYNKEAVISYLLNPPKGHDPGPFGNDGLLVASHIRSLKDVQLLNLTLNPSLVPAASGTGYDDDEATFGTTESRSPSTFVCPITLREMNGSVKFVYRRPCGCVLSEAALKEVRRLAHDADSQLQPCPVDGAVSDTPEEWVTINPTGDELQEMKEAWELHKLKEKEAKKAAKDRKRKDPASSAKYDVAPNHKKAKPTPAAAPAPAPAVKAGASVPLLSASLAAKIAEQKKAHSPAIASLYAKKGGDANHVSSKQSAHPMPES